MNEQAEAMRQRNEVEVRLISSAWENEAFKQELLRNPTAVIEREVGQPVPAGCSFETVEEPANTFYIVLPRKPRIVQATEELSEEALQSVAGGAVAIMGGTTWNFVLTAADRQGDSAYFLFIGNW